MSAGWQERGFDKTDRLHEVTLHSQNIEHEADTADLITSLAWGVVLDRDYNSRNSEINREVLV